MPSDNLEEVLLEDTSEEGLDASDRVKCRERA